MTLPLIEELLTGDSKQIRELVDNEATLVEFLTLAKGVDALPGMSTRFYEDSRSLYQATASNQPIAALEAILAPFFGPPAKAPGKSLPVPLRFDATVTYLGGIRKDQALFLKKLKTGSFYGALWPWQHDRNKIEVHLGFCSPDMHHADYTQLETLVNRFLSREKFETISEVGGQIRGISLSSFLQMSEMEGATYTLKVTSGNRVGFLHLDGGSLIAAQLEDWTGNDAAYRIISWDNTVIQIQAPDPDRIREIHDSLMHVMMESLKIKDEATAQSPPPAPRPPKAHSRAKPKPPTAQRSSPCHTQSADHALTEEPPAAAPVSVPFEKATDRSVGKQHQISRTIKLLMALGVVIVLAVVVVAGQTVLDKHQRNRRYDQLMADLAVTQVLDAQVVLLVRYLNTKPHEAHRLQLEARLEEIQAKIEKNEFEKTVLDVSRLPIDRAYENRALSLYTAFLTQYPNSPYASQINEAIKGIRQLLGTAYFEELQRVSAADYLDRYAAYRKYLEQFPQGAEREAVESMIADLAKEYYQDIQKQSAACDARQNWDDCIAHCDRFLSAFSGLETVEQVKTLQSKLIDKRDLLELTAEAARAGDDYAKARSVYRAYLEKRPDTTERNTIAERISALTAKLDKRSVWEQTAAYALNPANDIFSRVQRLNQFMEHHASEPYTVLAGNLKAQLEPQFQEAVRNRRADEARRRTLALQEAEQARQTQEAQRIQRLWDQVARQLERSGGRFSDHKDGTVTDQVTGLTWSLLDSHLHLGACISYAQARTYVQGLNTGGHSDWRLPTAGELATIYKNSPFFPQSGAEWYWTAETFARGFHRVVDVVTSVPETVFTRSSKSEDSCGAVRAVRR